MNNVKPERSKEEMFEWGVRRVLVLHARIESALNLLNQTKREAEKQRWRYLFNRRDRKEVDAIIRFCELMIQELGAKDRQQEKIVELLDVMNAHGMDTTAPLHDPLIAKLKG